jgi:hypothetical protein
LGVALAIDRFQRRAKSSLAAYKQEVLGVAENGIWRKNRLPYPHILPIAQQQLNILPSVQEEFWRWFRGRGIKLHSDFHHLNSSQGLCFNLFFPLLSADEGALRMVVEALDIRGEPAVGAAFEFQPSEEEGTCFDFMIPMTSGGRIYFELKYTESEFGTARTDRVHLDKFERVYKARVAGRYDEPYCSAKGFLGHYQILRNIWHVNSESDDVVVFLYPRDNDALRRKEGIISGCAIEPFTSRVRIAYLETLLASLLCDSRCTHLQRAALKDFKLKYFPDTTIGA